MEHNQAYGLVPQPAIDVNEVVRRIRSVEQRMSTLQRQLQVTEQNMIANDRNAHKEVRSTKDEIADLRRDMQLLREALTTITKEVRKTASREDVLVIKKYLDLWQPVKFVTAEQVERIIQDYIDRKP